MFEWLADRLVVLWSDGRLEPGARLPAERALAQELGVSRGTVVRALAVAESWGVVRARRGAGRVVAPVFGGAVPMEPLAPGIRSAGPGEIDLRTTLLPPHPGLNEALRAVVEELAGDPGQRVPDAGGAPPLVQQIVEHYEARGLATSPAQLVVVNGAVSGTFQAIKSLVRPGGRVAVDTPHYPNTFRAVEAAGARCVPVDATSDLPCARTGKDHNGRRWGTALLEVVRSGAVDAAVLTADFQNPTGMLMTAEAREALLVAAAATGTVLVVDETLVGMNWRHLPMPAPLAGRTATTVLVGSTSKSHWSGLRVGWIRAGCEAAAKIRRARLGVDLGTPILEQRLAARLLSSTGPAPVDLVASRYDALTAALRRRLPGLEYPVPDGGLSLWTTLPDLRADELARRARKEGLLLTAGALFSPTGHGWPDSIRLPFSAPEHDLDRAVDVLTDLLP